MDVPWKKITEDRLLDIVQLLSTDHKQLTIEELNSLNEDISKYKKGGKLEQAFSTELSRLKAEIKEKSRALATTATVVSKEIKEELKEELETKKQLQKELEKDQKTVTNLESQYEKMVKSLSQEVLQETNIEETTQVSKTGFFSLIELKDLLRKFKEFDDLNEKDIEFIFKRFDENSDGFVNIARLQDLKNELGNKNSEIERTRARKEMEVNKEKETL